MAQVVSAVLIKTTVHAVVYFIVMHNPPIYAGVMRCFMSTAEDAAANAALSAGQAAVSAAVNSTANATAQVAITATAQAAGLPPLPFL